MRLSWPYLVVALVVLWTPLVRCLGRSRRRHLLQAESSHRIPAIALLRVGWNWLDLVRAGVGAWILVDFAILPPLNLALDALPTFVLQTVLLGVGVVVQAVGSSHRFERLTAPIFYLLGLTVVLLPWQGAVFGGLLGLVLADMFRGWIYACWLVPIGVAVALKLFEVLGSPELLKSSLWVLPGMLRLFCPQYPCLWVLARTRTDGESGQSTVAGEPVLGSGGSLSRADRPRPPVDTGKLPPHPSDGRSVKPRIES